MVQEWVVLCLEQACGRLMVLASALVPAGTLLVTPGVYGIERPTSVWICVTVRILTIPCDRCERCYYVVPETQSGYLTSLVYPHQFEVAFNCGLQRVKANVSSPKSFSTIAENQSWVLFCKPTPARTRELHSAPDKTRYKLIPTPDPHPKEK